MTKEVLIQIKGLMFGNESGEDNDAIETISRGFYEKNGEIHKVEFEEITEGFEEVTRNVITFANQSAALRKSGLVNTEMLFEEKKRNLSEYETPYGNIILSINGEEIAVHEEEDKISVNIAYELEANGEHLANCKISIVVQAIK